MVGVHWPNVLVTDPRRFKCCAGRHKTLHSVKDTVINKTKGEDIEAQVGAPCYRSHFWNSTRRSFENPVDQPRSAVQDAA